jgi:hypothetical protein
MAAELVAPEEGLSPMELVIVCKYRLSTKYVRPFKVIFVTMVHN